MLDKLGIDAPSLIAFLINFFILLGLLTLVLYRPVTRMLDQRSAKIKESLEQAERIKQESVRAEETVKAEIEAGRREGQALINQAAQTAEKLKEEARAEARQEAEALIAKARVEIDREREESVNQLRQEFADLAVLAAEKVIGQALDKKAHQQLIEKVLEEGLTARKE
ncbi:MAG: F0F1 ATP synthase subunit B [Chloroflexi bacterium]|nr:F0F1 ATP synthase subunit B [Chloroflexota bacterium]